MMNEFLSAIACVMTHAFAILGVLFKYVNFATFVSFKRKKTRGVYGPFSKKEMDST